MRIRGVMSAPHSQHSLWAGCYGGIFSCVTLSTWKQNSRSKFQSMIRRRETTWRTLKWAVPTSGRRGAKEGRLASWLGIETTAPTLGVQGLSRWTNQAVPWAASWITENTQGLWPENKKGLLQLAPLLGGHSLWLPQAWFPVSVTQENFSCTAELTQVKVLGWTTPFVFKLLILYKSIANWQCCDTSRVIAKGLSHIYACIHSPPNSPPPPCICQQGLSGDLK